MSPFAVLGLLDTSSKEQAKAAYRRLAQRHHPDRGGDEEKFKTIKAAYEEIEAGWIPPPPPAQSSLSDPPNPSVAKPTKPWNRPYSTARPPPESPVARSLNSYGKRDYEVELVITREQADYGCTVPFKCDRTILTHWVQPGSSEYRAHCVFPVDEIIGRGQVGDFYNVIVNLQIRD